MNVPASTISAHSAWYSASEPSTQWIADGLQRSAIFSIQRIRCVLVVSAWRGDAFEDLFIRIRVRSPFTSDHIIDRTSPDMAHVGLATEEFRGPAFHEATKFHDGSIERRRTAGEA